MTPSVFSGTMPALMTPCTQTRQPNFLGVYHIEITIHDRELDLNYGICTYVKALCELLVNLFEVHARDMYLTMLEGLNAVRRNNRRIEHLCAI